MRPDEPTGRVWNVRLSAPVVVAVLGVIALSALLRFPWLAAERLWFDEVFSVVVALQSIPEMIRRALADQTNPPGFYLLLGAWVRSGPFGEASLRTLPALAGVLTPLATIACGRECGLAWRPALVAGVLAASSPLLLDMSLELRAYAPLALFATLAMTQQARVAFAAQEPRLRGYLLLAALHVTLVMLHYFGVLTVLALTVASLIAKGAGVADRRRTRRLLLAALPALVLLAAWLGLVVGGSDTSGLAVNAAWITAPTIASLPGFASEVIGTFGVRTASWVIATLLGGAVVAAVVTWAKHTARVGVLVTTALAPLVFALGAGWLSERPLWVARYLIAAVPPLLILVAMVLDRLRPPWRTGAISLVLGWSMLAGLHSMSARAQKPDWVTILGELSRGRPIVICVNEPYVGLPLEFYTLRERLPVDVLHMRDCAPSAARHWAVYRPGTEAALRTLVERGAVLGPRISLVTELPETEARWIDWTR